MHSPRGWRVALAVVLGFLTVTGALSGLDAVHVAQAQGLSTAATNSLSVTAISGGFAFTPNEFQNIAPNATVFVNFTDASAAPHTFTIIGKEGWVIPLNIEPSEFDQLVFGHSPAPTYNINASGAGTFPGSFTSPPTGWYEFVCTEPGHFTSGMYGFIAFGMNLPANLTVTTANEGPGAALFIIIGTIVALVVIALVLGFVVGRRKGAQHEMPPERLGYPEPQGSQTPLPDAPDRPQQP